MRSGINLAIGVAIATVAVAQVTIQDLGSLGGSSVGLAINSRGVVTGDSNRSDSVDRHAFVKPLGLVMGDLNFYTTYSSATSHGYSINQKGVIVGSIDPFTQHLPIAFSWAGDSSLTMLGTLGGGTSEALGINASGQITGWASLMNLSSHAFLRTDQGMFDLGVLPGGNASSGTSINNLGQVTGWSYTATGSKPRAFFYDPGKTLVDLGQGMDSIGNAINAFGHVAGQWAGHAAIYTPRTGVVRIPGLDDVISDAKSINGLGQVVGSYSSGGAINVFTYTPGGTAVDLNGLLPANSGWQIKTATAINDFGQVTGDGLFNGASHAYVMNLPRCDVSFDTATQTFGPYGGSGVLTLRTHTNSCNFPPLSSSLWLQTGTPFGTGTRLIPFTVPINFGSDTRIATITAANRTFHVLQKGMQEAAAQFADVSVSHPYFDYIKMVAAAKITNGCVAQPVQFCPDGATTRGQMAVFVIRAMFGGDAFSVSPIPYFTDVPSTHPFFKHIQKMKELGITTGCVATPALYCPDVPVTRGQMAVFLVRALVGDDFEHGTTRYFDDVAPGDTWFSYIQKLRDLGITTGCSATSYCVDQPTTRGQMAVFLVRTFLATRAN